MNVKPSRELLLSLAPMMPGRMEALAELFLVDALLDPKVRVALADLVPSLLDKLDWATAHPTRQETSDDGVARHDIVLTDAAGRRLNIEVKGYAGPTPRQVEALGKGSLASDQHRIDLLIAPNPARFPAHPSVAKLSWQAIDGIVGRSHRGYSDLWLGAVRVRASDVLKDLLARAKYKADPGSTAQWSVLWNSVDVIKGCLEQLEWGKSDGPKTGSTYWYYGASAWAGKEIIWVGWVLLQRDDKPDFRLILEDPCGVIPSSGLELKPFGFGKVKRAVQLWPSESPDEVVDLEQIALRVRGLLSECDEFRERFAGLSSS